MLIGIITFLQNAWDNFEENREKLYDIILLTFEKVLENTYTLEHFQTIISLYNKIYDESKAGNFKK